MNFSGPVLLYRELAKIIKLGYEKVFKGETTCSSCIYKTLGLCRCLYFLAAFHKVPMNEENVF